MKKILYFYPENPLHLTQGNNTRAMGLLKYFKIRNFDIDFVGDSIYVNELHIEELKEKKLITFFDRAILKSYELRDAMFNFLDSLNITFSKVSNMIAYTFLIPLVPLLKDISDLDLSEQQVNLIVTGVSHYTGGIFASNLLTTLIDKIIKRFKD